MSKINRNRIFIASCTALVVTSMTFAIRAGILDDLGASFQLSDIDLGYINAMAFFGFPIATILSGLIYNLVGPKRLMLLAFICHLAGLGLTMTAGGFLGLMIATFLIGFANGTVEASCNPMIADMYYDKQTVMINRFHVWFPGGVVIGALCAFFMTNGGMSWQSQIAVMLIPTLMYGALFFGQEFPKMTNMETDIRKSIKNIFTTPLYWFMIACMTLTATTELGTTQWVQKILGNAGAHPMLVLVLVTGLMAVGRVFAGPIVHRLNPIGVLLCSAILAATGLVLMSQATGAMVYVAAIVFAMGVMYFWPTMTAFVGEYMPETGPLGMSLIGGAGMFATSLWQPVIGGWLEAERKAALASGLAADAAELAAGQATLDNIAIFPAILIFAFGGLFLFRKKLDARKATT